MGTDVVYEDVGARLVQEGPEALLGQLREAIETIGPKIIVIDSFKAIHDLATTESARRRLVSSLAGLLGAYATTTFLVGEYRGEDVALVSRVRGGRWNRGVRPPEALHHR